MKKLGRIALVLTGAAALSLTSLVAAAGPPAPPSHTIVDGDGDGLLEYGGVEPVTAPAGFSAAGLHSLLSFVQMTDVHVTDEESPGRLEFLDQTPPFGGAYRPNESLSTQTLEATVERVRSAASPLTKDAPEFTIVTGDMADSQQFNEARWVIDILDGGKTINPDSGFYGTTPSHLYDGVRGGGQYYDPDGTGDAGTPYAALRDFPGLFEAAQQRFDAVGLGMPWYATFGNHDALIQGNSPLAYIGPGGVNPVTNTPFAPGMELVYGGIQGVAIGADKLTALPPKPAGYTDLQWAATQLTLMFQNPSGYITDAKNATPSRTRTVPPDPSRCYISKDASLWVPPYWPVGAPSVPCATTSWVNELKNTTGAPVGHGIATTEPAGYGRPQIAVDNHDGYYSFSPKAGFRMIVLDTDTDYCTNGLCDFGTLDSDQFGWLHGQLEAATGAGEKVIVSSHHPLVGTDDVIQSGPSQDPTETWVSSSEVNSELCAFPAVLATVSGHTHRNHVDPISCPSASASPGFVAINTTSEMDYPAQARMIQVVENAKGQLGIATSMIDNASPPRVSSDAASDGPLALASIAREIGYNSDSAASRAGAVGARSDRNVLIGLDR